MRPALCADLALTNPRTPSPPPPPPPPPCRRRRPGSGASRLEPRRFTRVVFNYLFFSVSRVTPRHQVIMSLHGARSSAAACSLASLWPGPPAAAIFPLAPNAETPTRGARPAVRARCVPVSPRTIFRGRALHAFTLGPPLTPSRALLTGVCVSSQALQRRAAHACPVSRSRNASNGSTWYTGYRIQHIVPSGVRAFALAPAGKKSCRDTPGTLAAGCHAENFPVRRLRPRGPPAAPGRECSVASGGRL
jgi:hypothetical protein